ncbi:MAG: serine kinase [Rhizobiales bacterium]|nr:serine kinase [Hyphomicrobiales bacterium]
MVAAEHDPSTIHATAVLVGARAVLIRGPAGSGKSSLALRLLQAADAGLLPFARLVGDDRVRVEAVHGALLVRPAAALAGLVEIRGLGLRRLPFEPVAAVGWVVDLGSADATRLPDADALTVLLSAVRLPRLAVAQDADPVLPVLLFCRESGGSPIGATIPI